MAQTVQFEYTNNRGETKVRNVAIDRINWIDEPGFGYTAGWFATGVDLDRNVVRSFKLDPAHMRPLPGGEAISLHGTHILLTVR